MSVSRAEHRPEFVLIYAARYTVVLCCTCATCACSLCHFCFSRVAGMHSDDGIASLDSVGIAGVLKQHSVASSAVTKRAAHW